MHSRKKGKSRSRKPYAQGSYAWVSTGKDQILSVVEKLAKEGKSESQIGQILRDQYGIPSTKVALGQSVSQILKDLKLSKKYPSDLIDLIRRATDMRKHIKTNSRDKSNKIKLLHVESKIKRLVRYYRGNKLPAGWKYEPEEAALLVK